MVENNLYDLLKIGLTEGEAKVYLALHEIGSSTVGPIVKKSGVAYSNVYDILERLMEKGLVSYIIKEKTKHFQASPPHNLIDYLDKKEKQIGIQKKALKDTIPQLEKIQQGLPQQDAEIFVGQKGIRTAYKKLYSEMTPKDESLFFYIHDEEYAEQSDLFYYSAQGLFKNPKLNCKGVASENYRNTEYIKKAYYLDTRFVNFPIPGNIDIYQDKVLFIMWKLPITGILIHSKDLADSMRDYFWSVWNIAKK